MSIENHRTPVDVDPERTSDEQYKGLLERIIKTGRLAVSGMDMPSYEVLGHTLEYDFVSGGFPLITERDLMRGTSEEIIANYQSNTEHRKITGPARQALAEIIAFMNGARTEEELESYGCRFWTPWTTDEAKAKKRGLELGDLGPGSYGAAFHDFPTAEGEPFNQYSHLVEQIKSRPELRTHIVTPFVPQYISRAPGVQQRVLVVPCHGLQHFNVDSDNGEISLVHFQRSADTPIGLPFNMLHYAAMLMMVGQVTGYKPKRLIHMISNAHIYENQMENAEELVSRPAYPFPILKLDPTVKRLEDFRVEHFSIEGYQAHPPMNMGQVAV